MSDDYQPEQQETPPYDGPPFQEVTSQEDMGIFSVTAVDPAEQPLADAASAALNVMALDSGSGRALIIGANAFHQLDHRYQLQENFSRLYQEALASAFTWREQTDTDNDLADAVAWAVTAPPWRPKRPRVEVELPAEAMYITGDHRKEVAQRLREAADLVEAGYNLHGVQSDDYRRSTVLRFELSGEPVVNYPTDNSPALGGQKETT